MIKLKCEFYIFFRYLRPALEEQVSPVESPPAEHTSSGDECETSGDDVWGTPTSGGDLEEDSAFPTATSVSQLLFL